MELILPVVLRLLRKNNILIMADTLKRHVESVSTALSQQRLSYIFMLVVNLWLHLSTQKPEK